MLIFMGILLFIVSIGVTFTISVFSIMAITAYLHSAWWDVIPAFGFQDSILVGLLVGAFLSCFNFAETQTFKDFSLTALIALVILPFFLPFIVDKANDNLFPLLPDIGYGTVLVLTLIGVGFGIIESAFATLLKAIGER